MLWILLAFLSAALLGFYDVFKKLSLHNNAVIPVLVINTVVCNCLFFPFIINSAVGWITPDESFFIPELGSRAHFYVVLKAFVVLSSWICGYYAIKHLPLTIVGPINATRPIMTLVGALLVFGENLNLWQWAGVLLAILSFFLLSRSGKKEDVNFSHNRWIFLLVLAAILGTISGMYDKYLMSTIHLDKLFVQGWYNFYQMLLMGLVMAFLWLPQRKRTTPFRWRWSIVCISLFLTAADLAYFYALSLPGAMISIVSMVRRSSVLVSFLFGAFIFHEKNLRAKSFDLLLVLLGMICLYIGTR